MKIKIKKLVYVYWMTLLFTFLIFPFTVKAESFGTLDISGVSSQSQIELGKQYNLHLTVDEYPASGFYYDNITDIQVFRLDGNRTTPITLLDVPANSTPSHAKQDLENTPLTLATNPQATSINIYALVKYTTNQGQDKQFTTNPNIFQVAGAFQSNVDRVSCVYLGPGSYRSYIYGCYENWSVATDRTNQLNSLLSSEPNSNKQCGPITSEFGAKDLLQSNPAAYCNDQGNSSNCAAVEANGMALFQSTCMPSTSSLYGPPNNPGASTMADCVPGTETETGPSQPSRAIVSYIIGPTCSSKGSLVACYTNKIVRLLLVIASIGSVGMIIYAGILFITSGGDPKKITTAKLALTGAIIGLVIVLLSYSIQVFTRNIVSGNNPQPIINNAVVELPNDVKERSLTNTAKIAVSVQKTIEYTRTAAGNPAPCIKSNSETCANVTVDGATVVCSLLRDSIIDYYPDASYWGEANGANGRTYYLKGVFVTPNGTIEVYYKRSEESNQVFYDVWTPGTGTPAGSSGGTSGSADGNAGGAGGDTTASSKRVLCVYLGTGLYRNYIYGCYENWDNARSKSTELTSRLQSRQRLGNPCAPTTSEFGAADLLANNPSVYCDDQGSGANCAGVESRGDTLFDNICLPPPSGDFSNPSNTPAV